MNNIKNREEFFLNEGDYTQTEAFTIDSMESIKKIPFESRFYILVNMQHALDISFDEYKFHYEQWTNAHKEDFDYYIQDTEDIK